MGHAEPKAARLLQVEALLLAHPEGMTQSQIARRLDVHRSTVGRYIPDLPKHIYIDDLDGNRWKIDRDAYLVNVRLTLHEALAVHLAARLMATSMDKQNPHAAAALRKLGISLERLAPLVATHLKQSADVMDAQAQQHNPVYLEVLEVLTRAWSEGRQVRLWHRSADSENTHDYVFHPYFLEPSAVGYATYSIGWTSWFNALHTFKIERITQAELLPERFEIPPDFSGIELLKTAWGIAYADPEKGTQRVRLKFPPGRITRRVKENLWHNSQRLEDTEDGGCILQVDIGQAWEMKPFIRGWGPDCEVLEPQWLREQIAEELRRAAEVYMEE